MIRPYCIAAAMAGLGYYALAAKGSLGWFATFIISAALVLILAGGRGFASADEVDAAYLEAKALLAQSEREAADFRKWAREMAGTE